LVLQKELLEELKQPQVQAKVHDYQYNRKLLFKLLVMANSQLAEIIQARGPNTQINSACSGTSQAIAMAEGANHFLCLLCSLRRADWIRLGRCKRVIVVSADNPTSESVLPYIGTGFLALGAATAATGLRWPRIRARCRRR